MTYPVEFFGGLGEGPSLLLGELALLDLPLFLARLDVDLQAVRAVLSSARVPKYPY